MLHLSISITAIFTTGATIVSVTSPDRRNFSEEITICYRSLDELIGNHGPYYGCIVGRVANRIKDGLFELDGSTYQLAVNNGLNHLHGGIKVRDDVSRYI